MWCLHVRRRVLRDLLLYRWWRDVLLWLLLLLLWLRSSRASRTGLPCPWGQAERIAADAWLALRGRSRADTTDSKCLQLLLLLRLLGRNLLLILDWYGWWCLHRWWCLLRLLLLLLDLLPSLCYLLLLLLLYDHLLMLLLTIRIRHRVLRNVTMRVKSNTDAIWRSSAILRSWSLSLVAGIIDVATAWRCGRYAPGRRVAE